LGWREPATQRVGREGGAPVQLNRPEDAGLPAEGCRLETKPGVAWGIPATKVGKSWLYNPVVFERVDAAVMAMFAEFANEANTGVQKAA
jgi:hypothetical protein